MDSRDCPTFSALNHHWQRCGLLLVLTAFCSPSIVAAQDLVAEDGLFITVHHPITSPVMVRVQQTTEWARHRTDRKVRKIIFDFNPGNHPAGTSLYGPCYDLAKYLLSIQDITTVAFVHSEVNRHTVLPVLACNEIVMSSEARLGDVLADQPEPLTDDQLRFYERVALDRKRSPALILKMIDKSMEVMEGRTAQGAVYYFDRRHLAQELATGVVMTRPEPVVPAGVEGFYGSAEAVKFHLCEPTTAETRQQVAEQYRLRSDSLREDPLQGRIPTASRILIEGPVNGALAESLQRRVRKEIGRRSNILFLQLQCSGGDTVVARDLAEFFRTLRDDSGQLPVLTVAYIPERAVDTATFLALGCSEIVMGKNAVLGDFETTLRERHDGAVRDVSPDRYQAKRDTLVGLAQEQGYPPLLFRGMLDRELTIYRVRSRQGQPERRLLSEEELQLDQANGKKWIKESLVKPGGAKGQFLTLNGPQALDLGIARHLVDGIPELYTLYGIDDPAQVHDARPDWLEHLAEFLRHPACTYMLVLIGIMCLYLELKLPGASVPGIIAALCFILFFWSHFALAGQVFWLSVMLFLLGLVLLAVEIFVLPGFGVVGVSGIAFVVVGLGLATLEKKPETSQEWVDFGSTITTFGATMTLALVGALLLGRFLPQIPFASRLVLVPPLDRPDLGDGSAAGLSNASAHFLGAIGVAMTPLRPAGMVRFGDDFLDVVAEGSFVPPGTRVQVIEIEGHRIVVKEV